MIKKAGSSEQFRRMQYESTARSLGKQISLNKCMSMEFIMVDICFVISAISYEWLHPRQTESLFYLAVTAASVACGSA